MPTIDVNGAKQAGYSDQEINDFVKSNPQVQRSDQGAFTTPLNRMSTGDALSGLMGPLGQLAKPLVNQIPGMNTKAYDVPVLGGLLRGATEPIAKAAEYAAEPTAGTAMNMWNVANQMQSKGQNTASPEQLKSLGNRQFMSQDDYNTITQVPSAKGNPLLPDLGSPQGLNAVGNVLGTGLSAGLSVVGDRSLPGTAEGLWNLPGYMTKKGLANKATQAAAQETAAGKGISFNDLSDQVRKEVAKKLGNSAQVTKATDEFLAARTPVEETGLTASKIPTGTGIMDNTSYLPGTDTINPTEFGGKFGPSTADMSDPSLNPTNILNDRRVMSNSLPQNFFQKLMRSGNLDDNITNIARRVYSQNLHKLAPGTVTPDKLYHIYSTVLGRDLAGFLMRVGLIGTTGGGLNGMKKLLTNTASNAIQ